MTQDGSGLTYTFDAENRLTLASGMSGGPYCYVYDGNGLRVAKKSSASSCSSGTVAKIYWRSLSGDALAETDGSGSTTNSAYNEYVFFAGRRVGSRNGTGTIFYWFADQLGTTRSVNTGNGPGQTNGQLCYDADFTPYGQEMSHSEYLQTTACPPNYKFTGYERDTETGLDYAFARYYSSSLGRFLSTDPLGGSIGSLQSHNAYAYVVNNPLNWIDPSGMLVAEPGSTNNPSVFSPLGDGSVWSAAVNGNIMTLYGAPFYGSFASWAVFNDAGFSVYAQTGFEGNITGIWYPVLGSLWIGGGSTPGNGSTAGAGGGNSSGNDVPLGLDIVNCPSVGGQPGCHQIWNGATNMVNAGAIYTAAGILVVVASPVVVPAFESAADATNAGIIASFADDPEAWRETIDVVQGFLQPTSRPTTPLGLVARVTMLYWVSRALGFSWTPNCDENESEITRRCV